MNNKLKYICAAFALVATFSAKAQVTVQSPYSKFGLGNLKSASLPQLRGMGGISTGVFKSSYIDNINMQNPASYAGIGLTVLDIGMGGSSTTLKSSSLSESNFNASLSHVAMAFPVSAKSGLSIGILPFSEVGYNFENAGTIGTAGNEKAVNYLYSGEGGLTKAYIGYGVQFGDHFRIGANAEYLFGNIIQNTSTEYTEDITAFNTRNQIKNSIGGFNFTYGVQYDINLGNRKSLVIGYSGSSASKLESKLSRFSTIYLNDAQGNEQSAMDTLDFSVNDGSKVKLPTNHSIGFTLQKYNKWLVGADYRMGKWSGMSVNNVNQNLQDTYGASIGAQFTPDASAINGYFKRVDYRIGLAYDKTYLKVNNQDIKQTAITVGLGLPLSSYARSSFYKMNVSAEIGKRGKIDNGLIQENYINFNLGFMLNDKWFQRFRFD